ncbi:vesicle-fusing ATPase [Thermanaeromonas toyohensis ToBE]|uniref:Vesicle-fusing ATPase n=1 Tax=Thermanaeromonas toyohensis ToBE TaxID=698762 RepID=A0A1W1VUX7_9FIRM|nr:AAA family ATPase [Thermanaeromonas toyohensis]SMB97175.1 vesicle-fusing ATPase [Thermanaeromonas toyohensis ToBE]
MCKALKELIVGSVIGLLLFLILQGYDVMPLLLLGAMFWGLYWLLDKRGLFMARRYRAYYSQESITFENIGGQTLAIQELKEALEFLKRSEEVKAMGIRPLKGILLSGPPGTGKTLLAKAAASYTDAVFLAASGSEFIEVYAGVGAQRIRELFNQARTLARRVGKSKAIIFIDELEILGGKRGTHSSHLEYDQTLNQLLVEMDGLESSAPPYILVIGATNRPDLLDPALLRPGRFDRHVRVELPDREGRLQILKLHTANKPLGPDVDLEAIARETFGFSGAHLESVANEAAILALRSRSPVIRQVHLREAVDKVMLGEKLPRKPRREELFRLSVHEAGHALMSELLNPKSVTQITIMSRGQALGYTRQKPQDDIYLYTREHLEAQICICLAGSVAEVLLLGSKSTGSVNDFKEAVRLAKLMVTSGLSEWGVVDEESLTPAQLHRAIKGIITGLEKRTKEVLTPYRALLEQIAQKLTREETMSGDTLRSFLPQAGERKYAAVYRPNLFSGAGREAFSCPR